MGTGIASIVFAHDASLYDERISNLAFTFFRRTRCSGGNSMATMDFFDQIDSIERARLNVSEIANESINGLVLPVALLNDTNMSNPRYYNVSGLC